MANNSEFVEYVLPLADPEATLEMVGGKGASLARMVSASLPVPDGFHVTTAAYRRFVAENDLQTGILEALKQVDTNQPATLESASNAIRELFTEAHMPPDVASAIAQAYAELAGRDPVVAVRSSATAEDLPGASFAGQQESYLNLQGTAEVLKAVKRCWASLWTGRAIGYRARQGTRIEGLSLAVVVQTLVPAEAAGILFTANPMTGSRDQVLINAAWGLGEAIVGGMVTPDSFTVDKASGTLVEHQIADKQVMTAQVNGGTQEQPVPEDLRRAPVLDDHAAAELARLGVQIEKIYGMPMDIEWALADGRFSIVQARPVTGLFEEAVQLPDQWELPEPKGRYMRTSVVDFMPDPLSPLFSTLGLPVYNESVQEMMALFTNSKGNFFPDGLVLTIHDYAYYRVNFSAGEWWAMLSKLVPRFPKLIRNGPTHFRETALPEYRARVKKLDQKPVVEMANTEIWEDAQHLLDAAMLHLAILQVDTLGAAAGSEGLFTAIYDRFYKQEGSSPASAFVMGYNTTPILSEKSLFDLAQKAQEQTDLAEYLLGTDANEIAAALQDPKVPEGGEQAAWDEWKARFLEHQATFGHLLYDLDFSKPVPAEDPVPQLKTVQMYLRGEGINPKERQERLSQRRLEAKAQLLVRARGLRGWAVRKALGWAQTLAEVREDSIASIGLAYPRLRVLLKELGKRFVEAGAFEKPEDIFWLEKEEIEKRLGDLDQGVRFESMQELIDQRKKIRRAERKVAPPAQLPASKTYMGIPVEAFIPGDGGEEGGKLKGVGASAGVVSGVACVLHGPEDFEQMKPGGILVAKLTTPAWTPLFAMAAGVVTDIGGPLSHGSIVAREYGIPAVLGTGVATRRIQNGQTVTVDGNQGIVSLT